MARPVSADFSPPIPAQLIVGRATLDRHWLALTASLGTALSLNKQQLQVISEYRDDMAWGGLVGTACERVTRNQGGATSVVPFHMFPRGVAAWLGFQEVWDMAPGPKLFAFRQLGLTVHFGYPGDPIKPQAFRSEWAGIKNWTGSGINFQAPGAAHPHWQFDVLETLRDMPSTVDFSVNPADVVEDFASEANDVNLLLRSVTIERMHFASAAAWWNEPPPSARPQHMNAPESEMKLTQWVVSCVRYLQQELARCTA